MHPSNITLDFWPDAHFQELAREAVDLLRDHLHTRHFHPGNLLWREGDTAGMLVALKSGRVKIYRVLPTGRRVTLFLFGPGDVFGFLPFMDEESYPAYAEAIDEVEAEVMARSTFLRVLRSEPELAVTLIAVLGRRLRAAFDLIRSLSTPGAGVRVAGALVALCADASTRHGKVEIRLPVTAHDFAGALGLAPETFSRALTSLVEDGILERTAPGVYRVLDRDALERAANAASG